MSNALVKRDGAPLPVHYEAARRELAECERVDEAADWADKAAALASYARQSHDASLEQMAKRIRIRATRRCGELLKAIPAQAGARTDLEPARPGSTRSQTAREAGLSKDQHANAIRLAEMPEAEFEAAVESENPPALKKLVGRVQQSCDTESGACGPLTRRDRTAHIAGLVESLHQSMRLFEAVKSYDLDPLVERGTKKSLRELLRKIDHVIGWLGSLKASVKGRQ